MIKIKNLNKKYKSRVILENVNISFLDKGVNFLLGKNGAGKSTLIKCLLNLEQYSGIVLFNGEAFNPQGKRVFSIFDDSALYTNLTGIENIALFTNNNAKGIEEIAIEYLRPEVLRKKVKGYSLGEKKKIFLIIVELLKPNIIVMDEVSSGLDYETMKLLKAKIKEWGKDSCLILTGHQFNFYNDIIDALYLVSEKKINKIENLKNLKLEDVYEEYIE